MRFLPLCLNIEEKEVLLVGGGNVALHKLATLLLYTSRISVCAPEIAQDISACGVKTLLQEYHRSILSGFFLVYACTNNAELNRRIAEDARAEGVLVNVADAPQLCDFVSPAIFKQGPMSIAISSDATDVKAAIAWRDQIRSLYLQGDLRLLSPPKK